MSGSRLWCLDSSVRAAWYAVALVMLGMCAGKPFHAAVEQPYVVIVNPANPLHELSRDQVAAYFLKQRGAWPNGTFVHPVDLPPDSRTRTVFSRDVLRRAPADISAYWIQEIFAGRSEPPEIKNTDAAVITYVSMTPGAIGYVSTMHPSSIVRVLTISP
jgi:ABC-type phosphate transport system substrate-binding protein